MLLFAGLVVLLLVVALVLSLLFNAAKPAASSSGAPSSEPVVVVSASSAAPEVYVPEVYGDYVEEGIPLLLNNDHYLPDDYTPVLADIGGGYQLDERAAVAYQAMAAAAAADGINLFPVSGYRTNEHQTRNYNNSVNNYVQQGYSQEEATRLTDQYYARPGTSEHEAGLAVDVNSLYTTFEETSEFTWLQAHCTEYGFILRYNRTVEELTGKSYEPWHYRYVGTNHARAITELGLTLDEYVPLLEGEWFLEEGEGYTPSQSQEQNSETTLMA